MKKDELMFYWELVEPIGEEINATLLGKVCKKYNLSAKQYNTDKDEIVIYESRDTMYAVIGGTSGDEDEWRSNFRAYKTVNGVHKGIFLSAQEILRKITNHTDATHKPLVWVGYSRGGGLAQECCRRSRGSCVAIGSMRPFTKKKVKTLKFQCHQIAGRGDGVTRVPWAWLPPFWATYYTSITKLDSVRGLDHIRYREMIEKL